MDTARDTGAGPGRGGLRGATLTVAFRRDRPGWIGSSHFLPGVDRVRLGRGGHGARRQQEGGVITLDLALDERHVSQFHGTLHREDGRWIYTHLSTTNESLVDGRSVGRCALEDGQLLEISPFLLVFRADQPFSFGQDPDAVAPPAAGWRTFHRPLADTFREAARLAESTLPMLLLGPTGAGKERLAAGIHALSRRPGPFVPVNCAAFSPAVLDSELFGHKKGAFTGAVQDREGLIRASHRGTLFLDEVAEMPAALQDRLLRVLETHEVRPVGADRGDAVDLRIVAATNKPLDRWFAQHEAVVNGFREDLYYRLGGEPLHLPSLPERREDLGLMIAEILAGRPLTFEAAAARALFLHAWPGGARQLRSVLERLLIRVGDRRVGLDDLRMEAAPAEAPAEGRKYTRAQVEDALRRARGSLPEAARLLGCNRTYVHKLVERFGLDAAAWR